MANSGRIHAGEGRSWHEDRDLARALLRVARFVEGIMQKKPIELDDARTTLRLIYDMQQKARDGTLLLKELA